jgi:integrase
MSSSATVTHRGKPLTAIAVKKLKPRADRYEVGDPGSRGLRLVVFPSGAKSFILRYRFGRTPKKLTIGPVEIGLAAARVEASKAHYELTQNHDPADAKRAAKEAQRLAALAVQDTFYSVAERYLELEGPKLRSLGMLRQRLVPIYKALGARLIAAIKRSEIVNLLDCIEAERGPAAAHAAFAIIRRVMSWHAARSDDFRSPVVRGMGRVSVKERARSRILSDDEIRRVWKAAEELGPFGHCVQFLLLTGARRTEASHMRHAELTGSEWLLPATRNKTKVELQRPLSVATMAVIAKMPKVSDTFVFSADGVHPLSDRVRPKKQLDAASGTSGWRLHDLRRTARSLMSRAGVPSDHAERALGHVIGGVRGVYDRHRYQAEMLAAYEALAAQIGRIINPQENVVALRVAHPPSKLEL